MRRAWSMVITTAIYYLLISGFRRVLGNSWLSLVQGIIEVSVASWCLYMKTKEEAGDA